MLRGRASLLEVLVFLLLLGVTLRGLRGEAMRIYDLYTTPHR